MSKPFVSVAKRVKQITNYKKSFLLLLLGLALVFQLHGKPVTAAANNPAATAKVSFTFDDGLNSALTKAAPTLAQYGFTGTNYVITSCIGKTTVPNTCAADNDAVYMTWQQVATLQNTYHWEIGGHTNTHAELPTLTAAQVEQEMSSSKATFTAKGFNPVSFASPYGAYSDTTLATIAKYYKNHRGFADIGYNTYPYSDYLLQVQQVQVGVSVATVKSYIDNAKANGTWLILVFHDIKDVPSTNPDDYNYSTSDLGQIAAYVKAQNIQVQNVGSATVENTGTNMVTNGNFSSGLTGWTNDSAANFVVDSANHGNVTTPQTSLKMTSNTTKNVHLFSGQSLVSPAETYIVKSYVNITAMTSGEVGFYVDEYDAAGNWVSGQYKNGVRQLFTKSFNFTYKPTSASVAKARVQVIITANSGITAYLDSVQWFPTSSNPTPTPTPVPTGTNIMPNSTFDQGIGGGWTTDNATAVKADNTGHGDPANVVNSVKLTGATTNAHLFSPKVNVDSTVTYGVSSYVNVSALTSGEVGFYIDEYDANGNWVSGQYKSGARAAGVQTISFSYKPTSASVKSARLQVILVGNSGIQAYFDNAQWLAPTGTPVPTPTPTPSGPNLLTNGSFEAGIAGGWTTNNPTNVTGDSANHGSGSETAHSAKFVATTTNLFLFSPKVTVSPTATYTLSSFVNITTTPTEELAFYVDEYDAAGNWVSGQYLRGIRTAGAQTVTLSYKPTSATVAKASLQIIVVANSGITAYVDDVSWKAN